MSVVIVALPDENERVMEVSSEKKPHLTLLYLGDSVGDNEIGNVLQYVMHATSQMRPFYLTVDYRGTLGEDNADVLFFEDPGFDLGDVKQFRHQLLLDDTIKKAYDSSGQYPNWTPHLTLGYPETPANESDEKRALYAVQFDRIAVWTGDYEGPEFRLNNDYVRADMAMSGLDTLGRQSVEKTLQHYGKKGMRWGVTTVNGVPTATQTAEKRALLDSKDVTVSQRRAGKLVTAKGGQRQKAADDAVKTVATRQKAKRSTTDSLSNKELQEAIQRMQMEQQFKKLDKSIKRSGNSFISKLLSSPEARKNMQDLLKQADALANKK